MKNYFIDYKQNKVEMIVININCYTHNTLFQKIFLSVL